MKSTTGIHIPAEGGPAAFSSLCGLTVVNGVAGTEKPVMEYPGKVKVCKECTKHYWKAFKDDKDPDGKDAAKTVKDAWKEIKEFHKEWDVDLEE